MEPCQLFSRRTWRCSHSSMSRNTNFLLKLLTNDSKDARLFISSFKMARCQTSLSVMRKNSMLNTTLVSKMIELDRGMEMKQCPASGMVWAAVAESGRSPLFFLDQGAKLNQQSYRDNIFIGVLIPWARKLKSLVFSAGLCTITWGQKDSGVAFRECSALHY